MKTFEFLVTPHAVKLTVTFQDNLPVHLYTTEPKKMRKLRNHIDKAIKMFTDTK